MARLGSALLTLSLPARLLALGLLAPSSAPALRCSVLAALEERGRGSSMGVDGTGSVSRVTRAGREHPICAAGQGWPWQQWQVRDGCIAPACPCLPCLPLP